MEKFQNIDDLAGYIKENIPDYFLFPEDNGVKGFYGSNKIMIVGLQPSTGKFGNKGDRLLYNLLKDLNLCDCHLTDIIKSRSIDNNSENNNLMVHRKIFDNELEIIKPKVVIALGDKVYNLLLFYLADKKIELYKTYHYAYIHRWNKSKIACIQDLLQEIAIKIY